MPNDAERLHALTAAAEALERTETRVQRSVDDLRDSIDEQNLHNTRKIGWSIAAAAFAVVLSSLMVVGYFKQVETSDRLVTLVEQQAQTTERLEKIISQVLCPLYRIFVLSYNPNSLAAKAQGLEAYNATFNDIRHQYDVLGCAAPSAPPPPK